MEVVGPPDDPKIMRQIIQGAVCAAFQISGIDRYSSYRDNKTAASTDQIELVVYLIQSFQPQDAIEAALACQFVVTHIRGMHDASEGHFNTDLLAFSHVTLNALQRYRNKGQQQINVRYTSHANVVNIKTT